MEFGEIEVQKKSNAVYNDNGDIEVEKKHEVEVDKKTNYGDADLEKKSNFGEIEVEKKYENSGGAANDEGQENSCRTSLVGETNIDTNKGPKNTLFKSLSPGAGLIQRITPTRQKRALAKIKTISLRNRGRLDPPLNDHDDSTDQEFANSTSDSQTSPNMSDNHTSPEHVDDESDESTVSENGDTVGSLRHIGDRRHVGMAGLYSSGPSRPAPRSRPALAGNPSRPPPRHALRPALNRQTGASTRKLPSRQNLQSKRSFQEPPIKVQNFQDYLKMQQMQSARRFDNAWNLDDPEEEEKMFDVPSMSISTPQRGSEQSSEFNIDIKGWTRPSEARRVASTQGITHLAQSAAWFDFLENVNDDDEGTNRDFEEYDVDNDHDVRTPFYSRPSQRQRWAAKQVLPHVNWGDLFFDLFFVSMAANLGNMVVGVLQKPANVVRGIIYFIGCFGPLFHSWENKTKARYTVNDTFHQVFDIARIFVVGFAVLHIKSLDLFADPKSIEMGVFTFSLVMDSFLSLLINIELYFFAKGDKTAIQTTTRHKMIQNAIFETPYLIATVLAGIFYWSDVAIETENKERHLWRLADLPLTLCCASYLLRILTQIAIMQYHNRSKKIVDFTNRFVPRKFLVFEMELKSASLTDESIDTTAKDNIEFLIQRYGEWVMLMIGENVLALLIVDTIESMKYYIVTTIGKFCCVFSRDLVWLFDQNQIRRNPFTSFHIEVSYQPLLAPYEGVVTVTTLHFLKHESDPRKPSRHALLRGTSNGLFYSVCVQLFSMTLIAFGVSLRIFLEAILKTFYKEPYDIADSAVATLHCMTLTVVLFSLELIHMSHSSSENGRSGFSFCKHKQFSVSALFVVSAVSKTFLLLYTATLPFWKTDPVFLSVSSSMVTGFFALSRMITTNYQLMARRKGTPEEVRKSMLDDFSMMSSSHNSMSDSAEIDNNIVSA